MLAVLALWPLLRRGYVLTYDMVFLPDPPLTPSLLGLGPAVPRAVPSDAVVALLARLLPADVVQKLVLAGVFVMGGWGASRLTPAGHPLARAAAASYYVWNAYVYERLLLGHWTLLVSYAALPWVARAAVDLRAGAAGALPRLVAGLAAASFASASGGLVATATALALACAPGRVRARTGGAAAEPTGGGGAEPTGGGERARGGAGWRAGAVLGAGVVLALPWLVPSLLRPGGLPPRPSGVEAFAARADTPLGLLGSLATLGGVWNPQVVPPGRNLLVAVPALLLLLGLAVAGLRDLPRRWPPGAARGLLAMACAALLVAAAGALPVLSDALRGLVTAVPGAGLLRDGQRYLAPLALAQAVGYGLAADRIAGALGGRRPAAVPAEPLRTARARMPLPRRAAAVLAGLACAPVLVLPVLAGGAGGRLVPVRYQEDFARARALMAVDPVAGAVLVLPWGQYVAPAYNGGRPVLDPALRWFPRRTVGSADLPLQGVLVAGEDPYAALAAPVAQGGAPLAEALAPLGVRYVLVNELDGWEDQAARLEGLDLVLDGAALRLYRAPPPDAVDLPAAPAAPVLSATALSLAVALAACVGVVKRTRSARRGAATVGTPQRAEESG